MAGGKGGGGLQQWDDATSQPAAPLGLQQQAQDARQEQRQSGTGGGLNQWADATASQETPSNGVAGAQSWYTGANTEGTNNGWSTTFVQDFIAGQEAAAAEGGLNTYFEQPDATGVVTWDHDSTDGTSHYTFGDVYEKGEFKGNIYDQFSKGQADLMMADWLFDGDTKADIFSDSDIQARLTSEVQAKREENNTEIPKALAAQEFNADVQDTAEAMDENQSDWAIVAGGALGGGAIGAGAGALTGPGALITGLVGAGIGGFGAWMNKDALTEQAARAYEITAMSTEENGVGAGIFTGINQWAGFGGRMISPLSNFTQGLTDVAMGDVGDGESEFYRTDAKGDSVVPAWVKGADIAASVGDSMLQFASPVGSTLYLSQMGGVIAGEVGELAITGGESFDYSRGGFDNIFTDDQGNFDASSAAAGIGKVGIDAVQMGVARGLMGKTDSLRAATGAEGIYGTGRLRSLLPTWAGGRTAEEATNIANKTWREVEVGGFRHVLDESGNVVSRRATLSLLAPSEQVGALNAKILATRQSAREGGAYTADDFYRAATSISSGERKVNAALANAIGESWEEGVQYVFDQHSHGGDLDASDMANAMAYGAAGGLGMSLGTAIHQPSADTKMFAQAQMAHYLASGGEMLSKAEWDSWDGQTKRQRAAMGSVQSATTQAAFKKIADDQAISVNAGLVGADKLLDVVLKDQAKALKKANDRTDGAFVITQTNSAEWPSDAVGASGAQTMKNMANHLRGVELQIRNLQRDLDAATATQTADPSDENQAAMDHAQQRVTDAQKVLEVGRQIFTELSDRLEAAYQLPTAAAKHAEFLMINSRLRELFHSQDDTLAPEDRKAAARAVSMIFTRNPQDQAGSYQMLVPQIDTDLTLSNSNDVLMVGSAILPSISGDYDGDKIVQQAQLILDDDAFANMRTGMTLLGADGTVNLGAPKYEKYQVEMLAQAIRSGNVTLADYADGVLEAIGLAVHGRYDGKIEKKVLDSVLKRFYEAAKSGDKDSRSVLLDGLAKEAGAQMQAVARERMTNEWLWLDQVVRLELQQFQETYAAYRPSGVPNTELGVPIPQSKRIFERRQAAAATKGQTMANLLEGDDAFRQMQKLHYSALVATVTSSEMAGSREQLAALAQLYEALGQDLATSELEQARARDDVTARVSARLQRLALEAQSLDKSLAPVEAMAVMANVKVADFRVLDTGEVELTGEEISLAQLLLRESVEQDRREKDVIYEASSELQAKHTRLLQMTQPDGQGRRGSGMNAARAFVEVAGGHQFLSLLGDQAGIFGPHLTLEQFLRAYVAMDETDRRNTDRRLKGAPEYLDRDEKTNPPYGIDEVREGKISPYHALVDAILAVGHNRITVDKAKVDAPLDQHHLHGELADRSYKTSEQFQELHVNARRAIFGLLDIDPRRQGELSIDIVQRLLEGRPDFARKVLDGLIPSGAVEAVMMLQPDGTAMISDWVLRTFTISDAAEAEMHVWRNVLLAEWTMAGATGFREETTDGQRGRDYAKLKRRMHRVMFRLAALPDGGLLYRDFLEKLTESKSVEQFMRYVNLHPGIRGKQAPLTAWVDDVTEFDMDKAGGGWGEVLPGAAQREAIGTLQQAAAGLVQDLATEKAAMAADTVVISAIRRVLKRRADGVSVVDPGDEDLYRQFAKTMQLAGKQNLAFGPQAMVFQTAVAAMGFFGQGHAKGVNPAHVALVGQFEAMRDAYDYTTNYERVRAAMTAVNLDAVGNNLSMVAKDSGRSMDESGATVEWGTETGADGMPTDEAISRMLTLFESAETRPMARAVMFPQVMERDPDGMLRQKLVHGKELQANLDGSEFDALYAMDENNLSDKQALKYVSLLEAESRNHGGQFSVQKAANDLVIARTSAAGRELTFEELTDAAVKAYVDIAKNVQAAAAVRSDDMLNQTDRLGDIREKTRKGQRMASIARRLNITSGKEVKLTKKAIRAVGDAKLKEAHALVQELDAKKAAKLSPEEELRHANNMQAILDDANAFAENLETLIDGQLAERAVMLFGMPENPVDREQKKQVLVDYVQRHPNLLRRSTSQIITLEKLMGQMSDSGRAGLMPELTDSEWDGLSRAIIAVYIDDVASIGGLSVAPYPDEAHQEDARYYDQSFSYLADPILDKDSALLKAGVEIHRRAGRQNEIKEDGEVYTLLGNTIFEDHSLGNWTSSIVTASTAANSRLLSSAAEAAISMPGNSPKREAVISAATKRTFKTPLDEHFSATSLNYTQLDPGSIFDRMDVAFANGTEQRPLAQLNNRFARKVTATLPDGTEVDLLSTDPNLGVTFDADSEARSNPLQAINLSRLRKSVADLGQSQDVDPALITVDVEFLHPDSQPAGAEWMNNLWFEGTSFKLNADSYESLSSSLWFAPGGLNQAFQRAALDASKTGTPALQVIEAPHSRFLSEVEQGWGEDLASVLRAKTEQMLRTDFGAGKLEDEYYNAIYKDMKLRHYVRGKDDQDADVWWTAEQVIEFQRANPGTPLPIQDAKLWIPTDDVLRTLLGEQANQGVKMTDSVFEFDLDKVPAFTGISPQMAGLFGTGQKTLDQTWVVNRARQTTMGLRIQVSEKERRAYDLYMKQLDLEKYDIDNDRAEYPQPRGRGGFRTKTNLRNAVKAARDALRAEDLSFDWSGISRHVGPRAVVDNAISRRLLDELDSVLEQGEGYENRTGWVYRESGPGTAPAGQLNQNSLHKAPRPALKIAKGDLVVIELDSFREDKDTMLKRLQYIADRGAIIVLGSADGGTALRKEASEFLLEYNYGKVAGSKHVYRPQLHDTRYANQRAAVSTLLETRGVSQRGQVATLNVTGLPIQEGAAWTDFGNSRLGSIGVRLNLVPTSFLGGFNVPVDDASDESQVEAVREFLKAYDTQQGRDHLRSIVDGDKAEWDAAFDRLLSRFDEKQGTVLPQVGREFGTGDIIPLVDREGRVLLYRHGHEAPTRDQVEEAMRKPRWDTNPGNVAVFSSKRNDNATTHTGTVTAWHPRTGYGFGVELQVPLQQFGDKKVLEWNGMKYILTPRPSDIELPDHPFFKNGWGVDILTDTDGVVSKEAFDGLVIDHRNAFAYFGVDFLPDVAKALGVDNSTALTILRYVADRADRVPVELLDTMMDSGLLDTRITDAIGQVTGQVKGLTGDWLGKIGQGKTVEQQITKAVLLYLMAPGAKVEHVLSSGSFADGNAQLRSQSVLMPRLFTQAFDNGSPELRKEMNRRFNVTLYNPKKDGTGYYLDQNFMFHVRNADPKKNLAGRLQFSEAHSSGDNPLFNGMAFSDGQMQGYSVHSAGIARQAIGARTAYSLADIKAYTPDSKVHHYTAEDAKDGGAWRVLTGIDKKSLSVLSRETPAEAARRSLAKEAVGQFRHSIDTRHDSWTDTDRQQYTELVGSILAQLNLSPKQTELVDYWVRQFMGISKGVNEQGEMVGYVTGAQALESAKEILWAVTNKYLPTVAAQVPLLHVQDLQLIYRANKKSGWAPRTAMDQGADTAGSWDDWVTTSIGSAFTTSNLFDPLYLLALDGFMHSYQDATREVLDLPVSMSMLKTQQLLDEKTNRMLVSLDQNTDVLASSVAMLDTARGTMAELLGGQRVAGRLVPRHAPASEIAKRIERNKKWRKENNVPVPVDTTMRNFRKNGVEFIDHGTTTNALARGLINLRVGTALLNPALYFSMGPEQWVRGTLDRAANLLTGQNTTGVTGKIAAKAGLSTFRPEQIDQLTRLYKTLGQRGDFKSMVYSDLFYLRPHEEGQGRFGRALENYAKLGSRVQDPTYGMRATTLARRYMEAAMQSLAAMGTATTLTPDQLMAEMAVDPQFLKKRHPDIHRDAANAIAQLRSLKETVLSQALKGIYEPLSASDNAAVNLFGNLVLKLPLLFSGYAMNVATTITGMQGINDMLAVFMHGRTNGFKHPATLLGRVQAKLAGKEIPLDATKNFDMSSVIEGVDLSRSFIRGGLTHTGLFMFGMMAGGLGLSGEDDETKKRRKLSEAQGAGFVYDPRRLENDFRNADAIFLDWLPPQLAQYWMVGNPADPEEMRSMAQLNWTMKQFISPIMGMEKFFETGDFNHVTWGFQDALGAFPLINTLMWDDAVQTAHEMAVMAKEQEKLGGPSNMVQASLLLTNAVGVYERMLFENAFVNQMYVSFDRYDRDPYVLPLRDSDGTIQKDIEGNARPNDLALEPYVDPETGEIRTGYQTRDTASATLHALTENRASMGFVMSLFDGGPTDSDYWRYNMPEKLRDMEKPEVTRQQAEEYLQAAIQGATGGAGLQTLNADELAQIWKNQAAASGEFVNWADIDKAAAEYVARVQAGKPVDTSLSPLDPTSAVALSVVDKEGYEQLTQLGAASVIRGLMQGSVQLNSPSLAGVYITSDMREQIEADWTKELIQEGIDMGLDTTKATSRMKRMMYGPIDDPSIPGIHDIIWSKDIGWNRDVTYKQLNTTYVIGPDGLPWATGFQRGNLMTALGIAPVKRAWVSEQGATSTDQRGNTTDLVNGINTGLRALELVDESAYIPTDKEIGDSIIQAIKDAKDATYTPYNKPESSGGGNYGGYRRYSGGGGYGGYSSGGGYPQFSRMYALPGGTTAYANDVPFINTSNPLIRRADVRRERVWSERGRLMQWQ